MKLCRCSCSSSLFLLFLLLSTWDAKRASVSQKMVRTVAWMQEHVVPVQVSFASIYRCLLPVHVDLLCASENDHRSWFIVAWMRERVIAERTSFHLADFLKSQQPIESLCTLLDHIVVTLALAPRAFKINTRHKLWPMTFSSE